jgi:hypothetical protein
MGWVVNVTARPVYPPGNTPSTNFTEDWLGPKAGVDRCGKSRPHREFFFLCTLSVLLCPDCPGFAFFPSLCNTHNIYIHAPRRDSNLQPL